MVIKACNIPPCIPPALWHVKHEMSHNPAYSSTHSLAQHSLNEFYPVYSEQGTDTCTGSALNDDTSLGQLSGPLYESLLAPDYFPANARSYAGHSQSQAYAHAHLQLDMPRYPIGPIPEMYEQYYPTYTPLPVHTAFTHSTLSRCGYQAYQNHLADLERMPLSTSESPHINCTWDGGRCRVTLDDFTASGVLRHLRECHFKRDAASMRNLKLKCLWTPDCRSHEMNYDSLGKHVAQVHLKSTERICEFCGGTFARSDALIRHQRERCEAACRG